MRTRTGLALWIELATFAISGALLCATAPLVVDKPAEPTSTQMDFVDEMQLQRDRIDLRLSQTIADHGVRADRWLERNAGRDQFVEHLKKLGVEDIWYVSSLGDPDNRADGVMLALPEDPELRGPVIDFVWDLAQRVDAPSPERNLGSRYIGLWLPQALL